MMNDAMMLEILERVRNRFYGKYRGTVTEVDADTLRIKAKVPAVLQQQATGWCMPCVPYAGKEIGFAFLPEEGAGVWIEFEGGDVSYPIWTGCYWHTDEQPKDAAPEVKVIVTKAKHKILLDDKAKSITITDARDNKITMDDDGITLKQGSGVIKVKNTVNINNGALEVT
jgi:uncharacterized protein involved in type VI secretion and phage assembly